MSVAEFFSVIGGAALPPDQFDLNISDSHNNNGGGNGGVYFNNNSYPGYRNTNGRMQVDGTLVPGQKTLVIVVVGQSNSCAVSETPYFPTSPLVHNLNIYDGGVYHFVDPPLGCSQTSIISQGFSPPSGTWLGRLGDKLVAGGAAARVIMVPASMAGSWVGDWDPAAAVPNNYVRLRVALLRCFALGYMPDAIIWHQGEGDSGSNTPQANYQASASRMIAQSRLEGYSGPWFVCQVSWNGSATNNNIRAAQAALVNHSLGIYAGADTDTLDNSWRLDTGHFSNAGMDQVATKIRAALQAYGAPFV